MNKNNTIAQQVYNDLERTDAELEHAWQREVLNATPIIFKDVAPVLWKESVTQYVPKDYTIWQRIKLWWYNRNVSITEFRNRLRP